MGRLGFWRWGVVSSFAASESSLRVKQAREAAAKLPTYGDDGGEDLGGYVSSGEDE